jgi:uncharacterized protein YdhG (YjbR/CyaY superfamily)
MGKSHMATDVTDYLSGLADSDRSRIDEIYSRARELVPDSVEGLSYGMPALLYRGKGLISVMRTAKHIGVYPFGNLGELADEVTAAGLDTTKGSIHLKDGQSLPVDLLDAFVRRRVAQIDGAGH